MYRRAGWVAVVTAAVLAVPTLYADVKTKEKTTVKLEGMLGRMSRMFGGSGDPISTTIALKGPRRISLGETNGEIVDLKEEKVYRIDVKRKEYRVLTFADIRKEWQEAREKANESAEEMAKAQSEAGDAPKKDLEFTADVKTTGAQKTFAGHDTREVVVTITGKEKGKTLEEGGGIVLTTTMWLAPRIAALDELTEFELKYMKAIIGEDGAAQLQQLMAVSALYPAMQPAMEKLQAENRKLQGTALMSTTVFETVKSQEQVKAAAAEKPSGGGGLAGRLAGRMMGGRGQQTGPRSTVFTTTRELLSVDTSATDADVAIPAGFKEKK